MQNWMAIDVVGWGDPPLAALIPTAVRMCAIMGVIDIELIAAALLLLAPLVPVQPDER